MSILNKLRYWISILLDSQTPWHVKLLIAGGVLYLLIPLDFLPDTIPFFGLVDDLTIGAAIMAFALRMVPEEIKKKHLKKK